MDRGGDMGHDVPGPEAGLPPGPEIERNSMDHGFDEGGPAAIGEQAQDPGNPQGQVQSGEAGEQPGLEPGALIEGRLRVPARQQDNVVSADPKRIGTKADLRDEGLPAQTLTEVRLPSRCRYRP